MIYIGDRILNYLKLLSFFLTSILSLIIPKKKGMTLFFCNETGLFGGNIKPLFLEAARRYKHKDLMIVSFNKRIELPNEFKQISSYLYPSLKGIWSFLRADKVVIEHGLRIEQCGLALNSQVFQIWHGANLKYMVKQADEVLQYRGFKMVEKLIRIIKVNLPKYEFIISPSEFYATNTFSKSFNSKKVLVAGYPRNDLFFREENDEDYISSDIEIIKKVIKHKKNGGKVLFYCPTWRDNAESTERVIPFSDKLKNFVEDNNFLFIIKKHHRDLRTVYIKDHPSILEYRYDKDAYLLMKYVDLLVTDYSSIFFDFLHTGKPVVFYPYDYQVYVKRDRLFQYDYDTFTPGRKCYNEDELFSEILHAIKSDDYYVVERDEVKKIAFGNHPLTNSSSFIWKSIEEYTAESENYFKNTLYSLTNRIASIILTVISMIVIARTLGPEGQGKYSLLTQLPRTFFYFFSFGFPVGFLFFLGKKNVNSRKVIDRLSYLYLASFSLAAISMYFFSKFGKKFFFENINNSLLAIAASTIAFWFLNSFTGVFFQVKEQFKKLNSVSILQPLTMLGLLLVLYFLNRLNINTAVYTFVFSTLVVSFVSIYVLVKDKRILSFNKGSREVPTRDIITYSLKSYVSSISEFLVYKIDIYIIAFFLNDARLGIYVIGVNIVERLWIFAESISRVLFARLINTNSNNEKDYYTIHSLQATFVVGITGGLLIFIFSKLFISTFFGNDFIDSTFVTYILVPGVILQSMGLLLKKILEARNFPGANAKASVTCLTINILLNIFLIPSYGIYGAAFSSSIAYGVYFFQLSRALNEKFNISMKDYLVINISQLKVLLKELKNIKNS